MKLAILPLAALAAACSPAAERQPAANQVETRAPQPPAATPDLAGTWQVTDVNGAPLQQIFDMTATAADDRLTVRSDCVALRWSYTQDGNIVAFSEPSTTECQRGRTANEDQVEKAIGAATIALFAEDGAQVQLSGSGGTVSMARQ